MQTQQTTKNLKFDEQYSQCEVVIQQAQVYCYQNVAIVSPRGIFSFTRKTNNRQISKTATAASTKVASIKLAIFAHHYSCYLDWH